MFLEYGAQSSSCKHIRVADFGVSCRHRLPTPFFQDGVKLLFCIVLRYNVKMQLCTVIANPVSGFISRNHLYRFLLGHAFADSIFELYNELELQQLLNQFFERATYYSVAAYEEARERAPVSVARARHEDRRATVCESRDQREERHFAS